MSDIQERLAAINARAAPLIGEYARLTEAVNKAITLILIVAAVGVLTFIAIAPTEQKLKADAIDCQEACYVAR